MLGWGTWVKCGNSKQADRPCHEGKISNNRPLSTRVAFKFKNLVLKCHILVEAGLGVQVVYENAAAKPLQSCLTLCDPIDGSPPGSPVPGILQARTLERVAISFSNAWKWKVKVKLLSRLWLLAIPWTAAHQAPPSMGFSRQEYWSGVPLPSPVYENKGRQINTNAKVVLKWNRLKTHYIGG